MDDMSKQEWILTAVGIVMSKYFANRIAVQEWAEEMAEQYFLDGYTPEEIVEREWVS